VYHLLRNNSYTIHLHILANGTDVVNPVQVLSLQNSSNLFIVLLLQWLSQWSIVQWFFAVASHFPIRHFESYKPPQTLSLLHLTVHPVLLLTVAPQYSHRSLNMFCILACHRNTFQSREEQDDIVLFCILACHRNTFQSREEQDDIVLFWKKGTVFQVVIIDRSVFKKTITS
jgi:hypothetical protein